MLRLRKIPFKIIQKLRINALGKNDSGKNDPALKFQSHQYLRHNARRLEHLASLGLPVTGLTVLEVGAGIGDHSHYYIDRGCRITFTEARTINLDYLRRRYPDCDIQWSDLENPLPINNAPFDVVHCYGLLYHLSNPAQALEYLSRNCTKMLFLETCTSFGNFAAVNTLLEDQESPTQSFSGTGCRPTRIWIYEKLRELFEYVYIPKTQPNHEEFPLDWSHPELHQSLLSRSIFIASREMIINDLLATSLIDHQIRHP
jgi:hypothetical protein